MKYVSGPYTVAQLKQKIDAVETSLTNRYLRSGAITDATEQRTWREKIEDASFGRNTVMYDDLGYPSVMVAMPLFKEVDVLTGARNYPHPAFIVNGATKPTIYISKYQNIVVGSGSSSRALSLKGVDPAVYTTFDQALIHCKQKGTGWHLMTNAEWAALALLCKSRGFMPRGNNNYGSDHGVTSEKGVPSYWYDSSGTKYIGRVLTGSGPLGWTNDGSPFGVYDLNGNVWEWTGGMRINTGEIQVLADNNAADNTKDQTAASAEWRSMIPSGTLCHTKWVSNTAYTLNTVIAPGNGKTYICTTAGTSGATQPTWPDIDTVTDGTAVWTYQVDVTLKYPSGNKGFKDVVLDGGATAPNITKLLALTPIDNTDTYGGDYFYITVTGELVAIRGGDWSYSSSAGVFSLNLYSARSDSSRDLGFRSAFVP